MKDSEILKKARDLIRDVGWCQEAFAKSATGHEIAVSTMLQTDQACSFCISGALWKGTGTSEDAERLAFDHLLELVRPDVDPDCTSIDSGVAKVQDWNDKPERTKDEVLKVFERAIQQAEEDGQ